MSIVQTYLKVMKDFCSEFGLTSASRTRIQGDATNTKSDDPMEKLLRVCK